LEAELLSFPAAYIPAERPHGGRAQSCVSSAHYQMFQGSFWSCQDQQASFQQAKKADRNNKWTIWKLFVKGILWGQTQP
jgi:hypothetical protein